MDNEQICSKILITEEQISEIVKRIGMQINSDYVGEEIVFVSILNGSFMFTADLLKQIKLDCNIDFMQVSTYGSSTNTTGNFVVKKDLSFDVTEKNVIIIEDILDTGYTMKNLIEYFKIKHVKTLRIAALIDKPHRRTEDVKADYVGYTMENDYFIVGYGLDYAQKYRNLPYIGVLSEHLHS